MTRNFEAFEQSLPPFESRHVFTLSLFVIFLILKDVQRRRDLRGESATWLTRTRKKKENLKGSPQTKSELSWSPQAKGQAEEDPNLGLFKESDEFIRNKTSFDGNKATKESPKNLSNHQNIKKKKTL